MTLQEAKEQVCKYHFGEIYEWNELTITVKSRLYDEVCELYARSKWKEAIEEMKAISNTMSDCETPEFEP